MGPLIQPDMKQHVLGLEVQVNDPAGVERRQHVQQLVEEGHLRWDSLGEFLALAASFDHIKNRYDHAAAGVLSTTLDAATTQYLLTNKSPSRKVNEHDNRGSHFYLALYWAQALADQNEDAALAARFAGIAEVLADAESAIQEELLAAQGAPVDLGGYYLPDDEAADKAMRPSATLNAILGSL